MSGENKDPHLRPYTPKSKQDSRPPPINEEGVVEEEKEKEKKREEFHDSVVKGKWDNVIHAYETDRESQMIQINKRRGTALHVALNDRKEDVVKRLVDAIVKLLNFEALKLKNDRGDTPLHLAATRGLMSSCQTIIGIENERVYLVHIDNQQGETPLFLAALSFQKQVFAYLCSIVHDQGVNIYQHLIRDNGDSILHCTIRAEVFDLALIIIHYFPELGNIQNREGLSPLNLLATRPSAFKSGCNLVWWKTILYNYLTIGTLDVKREIESLIKTHDLLHRGMPETSHKSYFSMLQDYVVTLIHGGSKRKEQSLEKDEHKISVEEITPPSSESTQHAPPKDSTWNNFADFANKFILGLSESIGTSNVWEMKQKHIWSVQLMKKLLENPHESYLGSGGQPYWEDDDASCPFLFSFAVPQEGKYKQGEENKKRMFPVKIKRMEAPILTAAKNGIVEMVIAILSEIPNALYETTLDKRNILLVAVSNRQRFVVDTLKQSQILTSVQWDNLAQETDNNENTMLHLAAEALLSKDKTWPVPGSAMQMMWDVKWFQYIQELAPNHFTSKSNKNGKTAWEMFKESHEQLKTKSSEWLKDTSESCSVVATLIAGVTFATIGALPGGNNQESGKPVLECEPAFDSFAVASLIGLCFSVTSLIMFLCILTSRKQARDFGRDLPMMLLFGLSSLFISIVAMFVAFCSGHFLVMMDTYKNNTVVFYVAAILPCLFYAVAQFPLYVDLLKTILMKAPKAIHKSNNM